MFECMSLILQPGRNVEEILMGLVHMMKLDILCLYLMMDIEWRWVLRTMTIEMSMLVMSEYMTLICPHHFGSKLVTIYKEL